MSVKPNLFTDVLATLSTIFLMAGFAMGTTMQQYFPEIGDDLTKVTWGHAVNSKQLLEQAIQDRLMMFEADVVLGTVVRGSGEVMPVMGHPPANTSDLSLKEFLDSVISVTQEGHRCGIKLDFKSLEVVPLSLEELQLHIKQIDFPIMLNADILPGPVISTTKPVEADTFLKLCVKQFPESTLSVGWTTRYGGLIFNGSYSQEQVTKMEEALKRNNVTQPVTFPIRAGLAARSASTLSHLKDTIADSTFTIWSSEGDAVDEGLLRTLIVDVLGKDRVYVDVPKKLLDQLNLTNIEASHQRDQPSAASVAKSSLKALFVSLITAVLFKLKGQ